MNILKNGSTRHLVWFAFPVAVAVLAASGTVAATAANAASAAGITVFIADLAAAPVQAADDRPDQPPRENQPPPPDKKVPARAREGSQPPPADGPPRQAGEGPPPAVQPLPPPEVVGRAMEILRARLPVFHRRLMRLREQRPEQFERVMRQILPVMLEYLDLRDRDPKIAETIIREFQIEDELRALSAKFRKAAGKSDEQAPIGNDIERLVQEQFELKAQRQTARLDEFERRIREQQKRLDEQRAKLKEDGEQRADLVAKRVVEVKEGKIGDPFRGRGLRPNAPPGGLKRRAPSAADDEERPPRVGPGRNRPPGAGRDHAGPARGGDDGNRQPPSGRQPPRPGEPQPPSPPDSEPEDNGEGE